MCPHWPICALYLSSPDRCLSLRSKAAAQSPGLEEALSAPSQTAPQLCPRSRRATPPTPVLGRSRAQQDLRSAGRLTGACPGTKASHFIFPGNARCVPNSRNKADRCRGRQVPDLLALPPGSDGLTVPSPPYAGTSLGPPEGAVNICWLLLRKPSAGTWGREVSVRASGLPCHQKGLLPAWLGAQDEAACPLSALCPRSHPGPSSPQNSGIRVLRGGGGGEGRG